MAEALDLVFIHGARQVANCRKLMGVMIQKVSKRHPFMGLRLDV